MTVLLFDVFGGCLNGCIIRHIYCDGFHGTFDVMESLEGLDGLAAIFGNMAANEDMRREDKTLDNLRADVIVGTCTVSATELWKGVA